MTNTTEALKKTQSPYPLPEALPSTLPPVPEFPIALLPTTLQARCEDIASRMSCAPDYPAVGLMVSLASVIGRGVCIHPKRRDDWLVVPNLWGCVVGRPSVMKSPSLKQSMLPLRRLEADASHAFDDEKTAFEINQSLLEMETKGAKKRAEAAMKKGNKTEAKAILSEFTGKAKAPTERRYQTNDATVEKLGELLAENERGILMFRDELAGWLAGLDKEGHEGERSFYLEAFDGGGSYVYDRIGRGTVKIDACTVSVLGGTQPGKLSQYVRHAVKGGANDDGLMQRFQLLVWPDKQSMELVDRYPDNAAKKAAQEVFNHLAGITGEDVGAVVGKYEKLPSLRFNDAAQKVFDDWLKDLMHKIEAEDMPEYLESHLAKYKSLMPSIALIIHLAEYGTGTVTEYAANRAAAWCQYLEAHARRMYAPGLMGDELAAKSLIQKIKAKEIEDGFTVRDVYRNQWASLRNKGEAQGALDVLEENKWVFSRTDKADTGRPTVRYVINPRISEVSP